MKVDPNNPNHTKVMAALRLPQYTWRTVPGVARDSGLPEKIVRQVMVALDADVCIHTDTAEGQALFAARDHLIANMTWVDRLAAAFNNRLF